MYIYIYTYIVQIHNIHSITSIHSIYIYIYISIYLYISLYISIYLCIYIYIYIYISLSLYLSLSLYIYIYIRTHTHIYTQRCAASCEAGRTTRASPRSRCARAASESDIRDSSKRGAVETGCSGSRKITGCFTM